MELAHTFDPNDVPEDDRSFEPLPAGDYVMQVIESEIKDTKSGSGQQLVLTLEVTEGPLSNRRVWDRLNIVNQNADAQRIAQRSLADLCLAVGIAQLRNTEELHFKPFVGKVSIQPDKTGQYGPQNRVRYKPRNGGGGGGVARPAAQPAAATQSNPRQHPQTSTGPSTANASRPWKKAS